MRARSGRQYITLVIAVSLLTATRSVAGQEIVNLPAEDHVLSNSVEDLYKVGGVSAPSWAIFGQVSEVAFDSDGRLHILDLSARKAVVLDRTGKFLHSMGGKGDGPGEFRTASAMAVSHEGTVLIYDALRASFALFDEYGELVRTVPVDRSEASPGDWMFFDSEGGLIASPIGGFPRSEMGAEGAGVPLLRYSLTSAETPVELFRGTVPIDDFKGGYSSSAKILRNWRSYEPEYRFGVSPDDGIVFSEKTEYFVEMLDPRGRPTKSFYRPIIPQRIDRRLQEDAREWWRDRFRNGEISTVSVGSPSPDRDRPRSSVDERAEKQIQEMEFPETIKVIRDLKVDWEGRIWVERWAGLDDDAFGPVDVILQEGQYLGTLSPETFRLPDAFGPNGLVAFIEKDEFDVPTVMVRRISLAY